METKLSTKGQIVLPAPIRRKLGLRTGDRLDIEVIGGRILLIPRRRRSGIAKIVVDPITGLPVLSTSLTAPPLSSKKAREILAEIPIHSFSI